MKAGHHSWISTASLALFLCLGAPAAADWKDDVDHLARTKSTLTPERAAKAWLELAQAMPSAPNITTALPRNHHLFDALPGPEAWPHLRQQIHQSTITPEARSQALRLLASFLDGSETERWQALAPFEQPPKPGPSNERIEFESPEMGFLDYLRLLWGIFRGNPDPLLLDYFDSPDDAVSELRNFLIGHTSHPARIEAALRSRIEAGLQDTSEYAPTLEVPDLITLFGPERAASILRDLLRANLRLNFGSGEDTRALARSVALQEIKSLRRAPWNLACHPDAGELFLALQNRFPNNQNDYSYTEAKLYHLYTLVLQGKSEEASRLLQDPASGLPDADHYLHGHIMDKLERQGHAREIYAFQRQLIERLKPFPYWESFARLSARLGKHRELMDLAWQQARTVREEDRLGSWQVLFQCALATDEIQQARVAYESALHLATSGKLNEKDLDRVATMTRTWLLTAEAAPFPPNEFQAVQQQARDLLPLLKKDQFSRAQLKQSLAVSLEASQQIQEAENLVSHILAELKSEEEDFSYSPEQHAPEELCFALEFYAQRGDHDRALKLLTTDPRWTAADLSQVVNQATPNTQAPAGYWAATALHAQNRTPEARKILARLIREATAYDPAYETAFQLFTGPELSALLEEGIAADRFQERPLIWKAEWLRREKRLEEALDIIRQAVAIDPSDGEIGKGRRMTAYVIWGRIARDQGDTPTAELMKRVEQAIRMAEQGDELERAGLTTRAIRTYEKSLEFFSDAYCIQSRLALRLSEEGRITEAAAHYERAFELMPDSFGRMESHCFGCEGAFRGKLAETTAERVFVRLIAKNPRKPQLHYLMGYLREQNGRAAESLRHYQKAVELDPDYINAWKKISELGNDTHVPVTLRDQACVRLLELDPRSRHVRPKFTQMSDLGLMWRCLEERKSATAPGREPLLALKGSIPSKAKPGSSAATPWQWNLASDHSPLPDTPEEGMRRHQAIRNILRLLH